MNDENAMMQVRTTLRSEDQARGLARRLIEGNRACCVHLHRIESVYKWEGKVVEEGEWLLEAKVPRDLAEETWAWLIKEHPYDVPLVEMMSESRVNGKYAQWARQVTGLSD